MHHALAPLNSAGGPVGVRFVDDYYDDNVAGKHHICVYRER